jgi:hypothetical protein
VWEGLEHKRQGVRGDMLRTRAAACKPGFPREKKGREGAKSAENLIAAEVEADEVLAHRTQQHQRPVGETVQRVPERQFPQI